MAKTLIGNVKGKDGRGISKIEKTATNGSIDTYTITYTDNTTYTFDIKNSSDGAIQDLIISSSNVESTTTASRTYTEGTYVSVNGTLKKVTSTIGQGSQFNSVNSQDTTIVNELKSGAGLNLNVSSTSHDTGMTFVDGKKIYSKTISKNGNWSNANDSNAILFDTGIPKSSIDKMWLDTSKGYIQFANAGTPGNQIDIVPPGGYYRSPSGYYEIYSFLATTTDLSNNAIVQLTTNKNTGIGQCYITVNYTLK